MLSLLQRLRTGIARWIDRREVSKSAITFATSILVGVGAGLGATVFRWLIEKIRWVAYDSGGWADFGWARLLLVPAIRGLVVGCRA